MWVCLPYAHYLSFLRNARRGMQQAYLDKKRAIWSLIICASEFRHYLAPCKSKNCISKRSGGVRPKKKPLSRIFETLTANPELFTKFSCFQRYESISPSRGSGRTSAQTISQNSSWPMGNAPYPFFSRDSMDGQKLAKNNDRKLCV